MDRHEEDKIYIDRVWHTMNVESNGLTVSFEKGSMGFITQVWQAYIPDRRGNLRLTCSSVQDTQLSSFALAITPHVDI